MDMRSEAFLRCELLFLALILLSAPSALGIEVVVHRGANREAPENTLASARRCVELGVDYVEVDVRLSRDGVHYIMHDPTVDRTTDGTGAIAELTSAEIDKLDAGSWFAPEYKGERVPRLENFLRALQGHTKIYFDVKTADLEQLLKLVKDTGFEQKCFFWMDPNHNDFEKPFRAAAPDLPLKINAYTPKAVNKAKQEHNANIIECSLSSMTPKFITMCRKHGMKIMINVLGEAPASVYRQVLDSPADMILVDDPALFMKVRKEWEAEKHAVKP